MIAIACLVLLVGFTALLAGLARSGVWSPRSTPRREHLEIGTNADAVARRLLHDTTHDDRR